MEQHESEQILLNSLRRVVSFRFESDERSGIQTAEIRIHLFPPETTRFIEALGSHLGSPRPKDEKR